MMPMYVHVVYGTGQHRARSSRHLYMPEKEGARRMRNIPSGEAGGLPGSLHLEQVPLKERFAVGHGGQETKRPTARSCTIMFKFKGWSEGVDLSP